MDNSSHAVKVALDLSIMAELMDTTLIKVSATEHSPKADPSLHINFTKGTYHDKSGKHGQGDLIRLLQSWHGLPTYDAAGDMARDALSLPRWGERAPLTPAEKAAYAKQRRATQARRAARQETLEAQERAKDQRRADRVRDWFLTFPELPMGFARDDVPCPGFDYLQRRGWTHETTGRAIDYADVRMAEAFNFATKGEAPETNPAVLFAVRNVETGAVQGFQAIAHTPNGYKVKTLPSGRPSKKTFGLVKGGAVFLTRWEADPHRRPSEIGLCEGVGDALAIGKRGFPHILASLTTVHLPLLDWVQHLWLFPDRDDGGQGMAAAETLAEQWRSAGKQVTLKPAPMGKDWGACV